MNLINSFNENKYFPWKNRMSIYRHIKNNLNKYEKLTSDGHKLPDSDFFDDNTDNTHLFDNLDKILNNSVSNKENDIKLAQYIKKISLYPKLEDKIEFYKIAMKPNTSYIIENVCREIKRLNIKANDNLYEWIEFLIFESPDREIVKLGIALIGTFNLHSFKGDLKILATHDEFSLLVFESLSRMSSYSESDLFELAKKVDGWGRIQLVERLSKTNNQAIKHWILTQGYKNSIMYDYLAYTAADSGDLKYALSKDIVDKDILFAARDIIESLILETNLVGISIYPYAAETIELFIEHTLGDYDFHGHCVYKYIYEYVTDENKAWDYYKDNGWTNEKRTKIAKMLEEYKLIS